MMKEKKQNFRDEMTWNALLVYAGMLVVAATIMLRVISLKTSPQNHEFLNHIQTQEIPAYRGNIYDCNQELLATSLPFYRASIDLASEAMSKDVFDKNVDSLAIMLADLFNEPSPDKRLKDLKKAYKKRSRYYKISDRLSYAEMVRIKTFPLLRLGRFKGGLRNDVYFDRMHPYSEIARRTIGFEASEGRHEVGLEAYYDQVLRGTPGQRELHRSFGNVWLPTSEEDLRESVPGKHIVSTLDMNFQEILHYELELELQKHRAKSGSAILMDVQTGDIKGIASLSRMASGSYKEIINSAIQGGGDAGSIFKAASLLALLDNRDCSISDVVPTRGGTYKVADRTIRDSHRPSSDAISIIDAFAESSNAVISSLVYENYRSNPAAFVEKLYDFGLGKKTGIQIENELRPILKHPKTHKRDWSVPTLAMMAYGYEMRISPLQMLQFYNAVANNGKLVKPRLVEKIVDENGELIKYFETEVLKEKIARDSALMQLKTALCEVVLSGTAKDKLVNTVVEIAGKTGTTQLNYGSRKNGESMKYAGTFVGYFPKDNPKYSLIVRIQETADGKIYASETAVPAFKRMVNLIISADRTYRRPIEGMASSHDFQKANFSNSGSLDQEVSESLNQLSNQTIDKTLLKTETEEDKYADNQVPDVRTLGLRDALPLLENRGLKVVIKGFGKVKKQSVNPGTIANGQTIKLILS